LRWVREVVCAPSFPAAAGGDVIFLGGGNDDLFYRPNGLVQLLADFAGSIGYLVLPVGAAGWESVLHRGNPRLENTLGEQTADIDAIVRCATQNGRRFYFVHDFLIWDLEHGRPPGRQRAVQRRREAVQAAEGQFIDLLEEFGQTAGVSWMNDFIHPSAVGQRMIADLLCERIERREGSR